MTPTSDNWSLYSASQNLSAVLNDPKRGKQTNFLIKTWGESFVEKTEFEKSPFLPEITYAHLERYIAKFSKRYKRHQRLSQTKFEGNYLKSGKIDDAGLEQVPEIFLRIEFPLSSPAVFGEVFQGKDKSNNELQEELSHYLDIVEVKIAKHVSQKSEAFFHAITSHDTIMEQMKVACKEVQVLRSKIQQIDRTLAKTPLRLIGLKVSKTNHEALIDKFKLISTVLQTQPTLQLLLSSSDYVAALELIASTQDVLAKELAGVTCLRHVPSQLKEMLKLIDKMLNTEFGRYAAADLHRPLDAEEGILEPDKLISLVAGLLKQNNLQFLDAYKQETVIAAQALLKQYMIEQMVDAEDDAEQCLTGSGEVTPSMDATHWLKALKTASEALGKLLQRAKSVHDVIRQTSANSLASPSITPSKSFTKLDLLEAKLNELLVSICGYCDERLASLVSAQSDKQTIASNQINELSTIVDSFSKLCENISGRQCSGLKAAFKIQAGNYVQKFHSQRKDKLTLLLDAERWKVADVPSEFQLLVDDLTSGKPLVSLPTSAGDILGDHQKTFAVLHVGAEDYVTVGTVLIMLRLVSEYCVCAYELKLLAAMVARNLAELLRTFNSRSCQLVLGAGALRTAGLKTITTTNLALTSRSLQLVSCVIPHLRTHFRATTGEVVGAFDGVERDIGHHIQQLESKILSIINLLLGEQLNDWDAKPPVPSKAFRNISRHLTKLHEAVSPVLPEKQVFSIYSTIHSNFKIRLRDQLAKMNIQNNGGPQHGLVTTEIFFYLETMRLLKVLPEVLLSNKGMEDIWLS